MADFKIQRSSAEIALNGASVTITAGTEYTAPSSITKSFIRILGLEANTTGNEDGDFAGAADRNATVITNPGNLLTSITFTRVGASDGPLQVFYEIIEYIGSASGVNEFIVRHEEVIAWDTSTSIDSSTISGVSTAADVVVFSTGMSIIPSGLRSESGVGRFTWEYIGGSTLARGTSGNTVKSGNVSIAVVEFTGSDWTVQRIEHAFVSAATIETETITTVGNISQAFTHHQSRYATAANGPDGSGFEAHLSDATTLTYLADSIDSGQTVVSWVVDNAGLSVERITGSRASGAGGSDPDTFTESHSTSASSLDTVSIMGETGQTDETNDVHKNRMSMVPSSLTVIDLFRARDDGNQDYRFEVVSWPEEAAAAGGDLLLTNRSIANYQGMRQ